MGEHDGRPAIKGDKDACGGEAPRRGLHRPAMVAWHSALTADRGEIEAARLLERVARHRERLDAERPLLAHPALRSHLEDHILPGLALYRELRGSGLGEEAALATADRLFEAAIRVSPEARMLAAVERVRLPLYPLLRVANRIALKAFPPDGWTITWLEDSAQRVAYDITRCFYLDTLAGYGAPELCPSFCRLDDVLYGALRDAVWERTGTLARGNDRCDFCFSRRQVTAT